MGFYHRQLDPKTKRLIAIGNLSLAIGLLLLNFPHPSGQIERNWLHGVGGFLLGLSITINLYAFRFARRCSQDSGSPAPIGTVPAPRP